LIHQLLPPYVGNVHANFGVSTSFCYPAVGTRARQTDGQTDITRNAACIVRASFFERAVYWLLRYCVWCIGFRQNLRNRDYFQRPWFEGDTSVWSQAYSVDHVWISAE